MYLTQRIGTLIRETLLSNAKGANMSKYSAVLIAFFVISIVFVSCKPAEVNGEERGNYL